MESAYILAQFHVPVSKINEMLPAIVLVQCKVDLDEWTPLRPLRLADEMHTGLLRCAVGFARIASNARANNIFPRGRTTPVARDDVIEVQFASIESFAAILAGVLVAFEDVMPCEFDLFLGQMVIDYKQDDAWDADPERDRMDALRVRFLLGEIVPLGEIVGLEGAILPIKDSLSVALKQQCQRPAGGANVNRLP